MSAALEAGRQLDALVAEALGTVAWDVVIEGCSRGGRACATRGEAATYRDALEKFYTVGDIVLHGDVPSYSTDIAAAWLVVEAMRAHHVYIDVNVTHAGYRATALFEGPPGGDIWMSCCSDRIDSAPLAICRAALAAAGVQA